MIIPKSYKFRIRIILVCVFTLNLATGTVYGQMRRTSFEVLVQEGDSIQEIQAIRFRPPIIYDAPRRNLDKLYPDYFETWFSTTYLYGYYKISVDLSDFFKSMQDSVNYLISEGKHGPPQAYRLRSNVSNTFNYQACFIDVEDASIELDRSFLDWLDYGSVQEILWHRKKAFEDSVKAALSAENPELLQRYVLWPNRNNSYNYVALPGEYLGFSEMNNSHIYFLEDVIQPLKSNPDKPLVLEGGGVPVIGVPDSVHRLIQADSGRKLFFRLENVHNLDNIVPLQLLNAQSIKCLPAFTEVRLYSVGFYPMQTQRHIIRCVAADRNPPLRFNRLYFDLHQDPEQYQPISLEMDKLYRLYKKRKRKKIRSVRRMERHSGTKK